MSLVSPIRVVRRATREIYEAAAWWAVNRPKAPDTFHEEVHLAFELIAAQPKIGAKARNAKLAGVRRIQLSRIRYYLYYRISLSGTVEVLALWHTSRGAGPGL